MSLEHPPITLGPLLSSPLDPPVSTRGRRHRSADVVVVGAGLAGLVAARRLAASGRSVVVLEARADRVGGRVESARHAGHAVDLGGAWIGADHLRAEALAHELGVETWPTHREGEPVVIHGGRRMRGRGYKLRHAAATLEGRRVARRLDAMTATVEPETPWEAPEAGSLDAQTLASWLAENTRLTRSRATLGGKLANILGAEPDEVSLLHALFYLRSSGGMAAMLGAAQHRLVAGGAQELAARLAAGLDVELGAPVRRIEHGASGGVRVESESLVVEAGAAVMALSPSLAGRIDYSPALPAQRDRLTSTMPNGDVTKAVFVYDCAFWRRAGLSGEAWGEELPFSFSYDMSPPSGTPGVLTLFLVGDRARRFRSLKTPGLRRAALHHALVCCFGDAAGQPLAAFGRDWAAEEWTRGAYCGYMPPGGWTRYGAALRSPVGPLVWAGTETAVEHNGYMEGAIESGERAAAEMLAPVAATRSQLAH
jgi:monoamine oxidase